MSTARRFRFDRPTCHLTKNGDGVWRGSWLEHERMPVEVAPIEASDVHNCLGGLSR
jgi:hypothetical protein